MLSLPSALLVARLKWLRLQQGQDGSKLELVTRSSKYTGAHPEIFKGWV